MAMRVDDINVAAWLKMLARINDEAPGYDGARASLTLTELIVETTEQTLAVLSQDVFIQRGLAPLRDELALLRSRIDSYGSALDDVAGATEGPALAKQVDTAELVRLALLTGYQSPPLPHLAMGDAALAATLYNQVIQAAAVDAEQNEALATIYPDSLGFTDATRNKLREWLTGAETQLAESAPGEAPTIRDKVVRTLEDARENVQNLLAAATDILPRLLKWFGIGAGALLVAYLLWRFGKR